MAIADETYFDWPELPEAPSDLNASINAAGLQLTWKMHGGHPESDHARAPHRATGEVGIHCEASRERDLRFRPSSSSKMTSDFLSGARFQFRLGLPLILML